MNCKVKNNLKDQTPMKKSYCSIPNPSIQKLRTILKRSWINKWKSSYASPIAVVCNKDGSFFRCDYRALIAKTILDRHPILHVQDVLDREESRRESRRGEPTFDSFFLKSLGLCKWIRVPFALTNALAEFQSFMENCLFDIREEFTCPYLDDLGLF